MNRNTYITEQVRQTLLRAHYIQVSVNMFPTETLDFMHFKEFGPMNNSDDLLYKVNKLLLCMLYFQ